MCGIAGFYDSSGARTTERMQSAVESMTDTLLHRGPDSRGTWIEVESGIALGHRRLAIRDLSPTGHQPMISSCGRFVIVYNGEVYSHNEISHDLANRGRHLRGTSDTEVILEACAEWGVERTLERLIGMFAFALFDRQTRKLVVVRDRLGIKPLYWGFFPNLFFFGSELKALRGISDWSPVLDRNALSAFMRHNYIPAPHSIYKGIYKLEPGTLLTYGPDEGPRITRFWDLRSVVKIGLSIAAAKPQADADVLMALDQLLGDAVNRRLVADVPVGALLSGGIDSSLVTALMVERSAQPINTFSIGFAETEYNEAPYAREIAKLLGTNHTELYAEPHHALAMVERLPYWYDEPFADSSQIPMALVCELTRKHVAVVLSGDGGDELFAGYGRYANALDRVNMNSSHWSRWSRMLPRTLKRLLEVAVYDGSLIGSFKSLIAGSSGDSFGDIYRQMLSHWNEPDTVIIDGHEPKGVLWETSVESVVPNLLDRMQFLDTLTYLPDDILTKVDRASMSVSLEARVPLLDHRVVEFAWQMPRHMKLRAGEAKWALRQLLYRRVPRELIDRPKMGFGIPLAAWLRGPLRSWAEHLLNESRLKHQRLFRPEVIRARWHAHLEGANWGYPLWNVLMAQAWIDSNPDVEL